MLGRSFEKASKKNEIYPPVRPCKPTLRLRSATGTDTNAHGKCALCFEAGRKSVYAKDRGLKHETG